MDSKPIRNAGRIDATEIHGIVYYTDVHFEEKECAVCGRKFKPGDGVALFVRRITRKGTDLIPAHMGCFATKEKGQSKKTNKKK